jgi:uncharacterized protein YndB with AHSA1/START domain
MPTAQRGAESIHIDAPPELVYDLITDVTRMGEWSPETYRCEWLDGATTTSPGARFRGHNRMGRIRWQRTAVVDRAERGREFAFTTVDDRTGRWETQWRYTLQPTETGTTETGTTEAGTLLTESFEFLWCSLANRATELFVPRGRQMDRGIHKTLQRIKAAAETLHATQRG